MYLRKTHGHLDPARIDEAIGLIPDTMIAVQQQPGCQSAETGVDRTTGETISVSSFDTQEHAQFPRESLGDALTRMQALGWQGEAPKIYESI